MSIQLPLSITFTPRGGAPIDLVATGGWLADMPAFAGEQRVYEAPGVGTGEEFFKALGGATINFDLTVEIAEETHADARATYLASDVPVHGTLTIAADGWQAEMPAVISAVDPDLPSGHPEPTVTRAYSVTASGVIDLTIDPEEED
ncbi:MAG: hypothetical protein ACNA8L_10275 [Luteolibacter sp.]